MSLNGKTTIQRHWDTFIRLKSAKRNSTMFRCNRFQIKLQIQKPLIVNFKIRNSQKFQSIVSFFLGRCDNNICVCVSTETSPLLSAKTPLYLPLVLHTLEKDTRIHNPEPSFLKVKPFGGVSEFSYSGFQILIFFVSLSNFDIVDLKLS